MKRFSLEILLVIVCGITITYVSINIAGYLAASTFFPVKLFHWAKANSLGKLAFYIWGAFEQIISFGFLAATTSYTFCKTLSLAPTKMAGILFLSQVFTSIAVSWAFFFNSTEVALTFLSASISYFLVIFICTFLPVYLCIKKQSI